MYEEEYDENNEIAYAIRPNKTQIKREISEMADFVKQLVGLSSSELNQLELNDELFKAITTAVTTAKGAQKRQIKYIVGLFRKMDISPIQEKLARMQTKSAHAVREHHMAERWRDNLISGHDEVLTQFLEEYPHSDRQQLRQLVRSAKKEFTENLPPKFTRLLYQNLKKIITQEQIE